MQRLHVVALNLARRHLTDAQKVAAGRLIAPDAAEAARRRQVELGRERGGRPSVSTVTEGVLCDPGRRVPYPDAVRRFSHPISARCSDSCWSRW